MKREPLPDGQANPFSTRWTRPGAVPFLFRDGEDAAGLIDRLRAAGWWGQIIGPHGSGKSTLVESLLMPLEQAGRRPAKFVLHFGQRRLPVRLDRLPDVDESTQVIVDGYEQLGLWSRWRLKRFCRRRGCGLLVTAHADAGMADLYHVEPDLQTALRVVAHLLPAENDAILPADVEQVFGAHQGDLRETLFALYDLYEARRSGR